MGLAEVPEKSLTVPRPFNLTKPSLRKVPEPMKIEQVSQKKKSTDGKPRPPLLLFLGEGGQTHHHACLSVLLICSHP